MDIGGWLRSLGLERWLRQLKGARQRFFSFSRELRLMPSHEDGGNNNEDQDNQSEYQHHPPGQLFDLPT